MISWEFATSRLQDTEVLKHNIPVTSQLENVENSNCRDSKTFTVQCNVAFLVGLTRNLYILEQNTFTGLNYFAIFLHFLLWCKMKTIPKKQGPGKGIKFPEELQNIAKVYDNQHVFL